MDYAVQNNAMRERLEQTCGEPLGEINHQARISFAGGWASCILWVFANYHLIEKEQGTCK